VPAALSRVTSIAAGYRHSVALFGGENQPPLAPAYSLQTLRDQAKSLSVSKLQQACSDPDGDFLTIPSVSSISISGGTVQLNGETIVYTPPTDFVGTDSFTYTVRDSRGASSQGTVNVTVSAPKGSGPNIIDVIAGAAGAATIHCAGIPGVAYVLEASTDLVHWTTVGSATAGANGLFEFVDSQAANYTARFYRTRSGSALP
jgi:Bacterial Ig domain